MGIRHEGAQVSGYDPAEPVLLPKAGSCTGSESSLASVAATTAASAASPFTWAATAATTSGCCCSRGHASSGGTTSPRLLYDIPQSGVYTPVLMYFVFFTVWRWGERGKTGTVLVRRRLFGCTVHSRIARSCGVRIHHQGSRETWGDQ